MGRVARSLTSKLTILSAAVVLAAAGLGLGLYQHPHATAATTTSSHHQVVGITYRGQAGKNAFVLLQHYARVGYKHYSFGDMVTSIDGVPGTGPKYWTFFVNGKQSNVGATSYMTKSSDTLSWKLQ